MHMQFQQDPHLFLNIIWTDESKLTEKESLIDIN